MSSESAFRRLFLVLISFSLILTSAAWAQQSAPSADPKAQEEEDPLKRPFTEKQRKANEKALKQELSDELKRWLDQDVRWIITDEERAAFRMLSNDEERDQFIEGFWGRRDPTPDTIENEYKEEHYRRIAYANERFAAGVPGWKTDRGRIYIMYGPPDQITDNAGGHYERPMSEGGGSTSTFPFAVWRYRYLEGVNLGQEIEIEFVDSCMCGEYRMSMDRSEKDALLHVPNAGLTFFEQMGMASKADRFTGGLERLGLSPFNRGRLQSQQFDQLTRYAALQRPPAVKFKELQEIVDTKISYNLMPFEIQTDFIKVTTDMVMVPVTIQIKNRDISFQSKDGVARGVVNIFGRVTSMTGRIAQTFEDTVQVDAPESLLERTLQNSSIYWKALPLKPGHYRVDVVCKDVYGDRVGTWKRSIRVPFYGDEKLATSTLILADQMEKVAPKSVGAGNFVIGTTKVRPRLESEGKPAVFKRNQRLNFWMQVYNLGIDETKKKPSATIEYDIVNAATNKPVVKTSEKTENMGNVGDLVTLEKTMPLAELGPGLYRLTIKVSDNVSKQTITAPSASFTVE